MWTGTWDPVLRIHRGTCYELTYLGYDNNNWTCFDTAASNFPNDSIQSVLVGSGVRLFLFQNSMGQREESAPLIVEQSTGYNDLGGWKNVISAARLVTLSRPEQSLKLCTDPNGNTAYDCVSLFTSNLLGSQSYPTPLSMCFHNDSASWYSLGSAYYKPTLFNNNNFGGSSYQLNPGQGRLQWFDNVTSSVRYY